MRLWKWFVGQVTRLRRSVVGVVAPDAGGRGRANDSEVAAEPAPGPPEHWVERVRRGAPGLLEPSLRRRGERPGPPAAKPVTSTQTELEPQTEPHEESQPDYVPPEPPVGPRRSEAPVRPSLLRKVLRRERSVLPAEVDASPAPTAEHIRRELDAATRRAGQTAESPTREPPERRRLETPQSPAQKPADRRRSPARTDLAERSPQRSEVVEFEAPEQRRPARVERPESPVQPIRADVTRSPPPNGRQAGLAVDEIAPDHRWEPRVPPPVPKSESNVERLREPAVPRPATQREASAELGPPPRPRAEPLFAIEKHPWPELPPPLDQVDGDVEAALRAWAHQQRIDQEQTRL
jgi:hypothetical protein